MQNKRMHIAFNIGFWTIYFLYEWLGLAALTGAYGSYFINACMALPLSFAVSYLTVHVFLKKYYRKGQYGKFWMMQILTTIGLLLVRRCVNYYVIYPAFFPFALQVPFFSFGKMIVELVNVYLVTGVYSLFYFVDYWYQERQRAQDLLQEKTRAELELLKSQVHPHFIFNTLNNIYSSSLQAHPESARLIGHLSGFLHYSLYEAKQDFVSLSSEIGFIKNFIELQKNRHGDALDISVNIYEDISDISIAPLLLLPLVENCFKHGTIATTGTGWVRIDISRQDSAFSIKIENSIDSEVVEDPKTIGGIGLVNVKKRLELLYPDRHEFKIIGGSNSYLVVIKIKPAA